MLSVQPNIYFIMSSYRKTVYLETHKYHLFKINWDSHTHSHLQCVSIVKASSNLLPVEPFFSNDSLCFTWVFTVFSVKNWFSVKRYIIKSHKRDEILNNARNYLQYKSNFTCDVNHKRCIRFVFCSSSFHLREKNGRYRI